MGVGRAGDPGYARAPMATIDGLDADDAGLALLGRHLAGVPTDDVLLVHCGRPPGVGRGAHRLVLDVREEALGGPTLRAGDHDALARLGQLGHAGCWPRAHLGKDFSIACLAIGARALRPGGLLWCSVRKSKGADSLADAMVSLLGNVDVVARDRGYHLLQSVREESIDLERIAAVTSVRYEIRDPALGDVVLESRPGVFSRKALDDGTRALLGHVDAWIGENNAAPRCVLDLCAGIGPLAIWAARHFSDARVLAVESNVLAAGLIGSNATAAGVGPRVRVELHAGMPDDGAERGQIDLALINPPTHAEQAELTGLLGGLRRWMAPGGSAFVVASRPGVSTIGLQAAGAQVQAHRAAAYSILHGRWPA